jgi:hypothetical protein
MSWANTAPGPGGAVGMNDFIVIVIVFVSIIADFHSCNVSCSNARVGRNFFIIFIVIVEIG